MEIIKIVIYEIKSKEQPFIKWLESLDLNTQSIITARINRVRIGNFGDCHALREGIYELRIHFGAGYRIYFAKQDKLIVIILVGGSKKSQIKDIQKAIKYWK